MKKIKIFLISFLGIILLSSCSSASKIDECFMYTQLNAKDINNGKNINDGKDFIGIIGYNFDNPNCSMDVEIPKKINGENVLFIEDMAFQNPYLKSKGVNTDFKKYEEALREKGCGGYNAYSQECQKIFNDGKDKSGLKFIKSVNIPDSVIEIGHEAFSENKIEKITFGKNIKSIKQQAFGYNNISDIIFHPDTENLKIQSNAFIGNDLEAVAIPYGTEYDKENSFDTFTEINYK